MPYEVQVILGKKAEAVQSGVSKVVSHDDNYRLGLALLRPGGAALGHSSRWGWANSMRRNIIATTTHNVPFSRERGVLLESIAVVFLMMTSGSLSFELPGN